MLYFANPASPRVVDAMLDGRLGFIDTPGQGNRRPTGVTWCADNGCFGKGYPGDQAWFAWLTAQDPAGCVFATAPDVVMNQLRTLRIQIKRVRETAERIDERSASAILRALDGGDH